MATLIRRLATSICFVLLALLAGFGAAQASMVHDPWLERFQVGEFRQPDAVALADGWPDGLLTPLGVDPGWLEGARRLFAHDHLPRDGGTRTWRLAVPLFGDPEAAERAFSDAQASWRRIADLADPAAPPPDDPTVAAAAPWAADMLKLQAGRLWQAGEHVAAARTVRRLLDLAPSHGMAPGEVFVWSLRHELLAGSQDLRAETLWRSLLDLGLYDTRSGWAVWVALRRARALPVLPPDRADREAAVMLATAGQLWLTAAELEAAGFPADLEAGLGALLLPVGDLRAHFRRFPAPPADDRFQGHWLRGQRRLDATAEAIEKLAVLPGLRDGHRLDCWRRASEGYLLRGAWTAGLRTLEEGLRALGGEASASVQERLRIWVVQALALALAQERTGDVARLEALAARYLTGEHAQAYANDAGPMLAAAAGRTPCRVTDLRADSEALVLAGAAPAIATAERATLPPAGPWRHRLWASWARWGLALAGADTAGNGGSEPAHAAALAAVLAADDPTQREATAVAAAAARLRGSPAVAPLVAWAMARDIEALAAGACLPETSPLPDVRAPGHLASTARNLHDHALLGAALLLGDDRGVIAMAVRLPAAGVASADRWPFWYPLPADPAIREALAASTLPPELLLAIARNESLFEPAVRSRAGALGYMQIMPFHYADPAGPAGPEHWRHPAASLRAGSRVLADAVRRHRGDPYRSVAAYNAGSAAVERWDRQLGAGGSAALYRSWISYPETRGYTLRVLRDREVYRRLMTDGP